MMSVSPRGMRGRGAVVYPGEHAIRGNVHHHALVSQGQGRPAHLRTDRNVVELEWRVPVDTGIGIVDGAWAPTSVALL